MKLKITITNNYGKFFYKDVETTQNGYIKLLEDLSSLNTKVIRLTFADGRSIILRQNILRNSMIEVEAVPKD